MKILSHVHTTYSLDGQITCEELAQTAKRQRFDAVFVTDHFEDMDSHKYELLVEECSRIKDCLLIPGYERDWEGFHILALNQKRLQTQQYLTSWTQAVRNDGGLVVLAHPARYNFNVPERILSQCDGVETWNSKRYYDGAVGPNPRAMRLVREGHLLVCGQDAHISRSIQRVGIVFKKNFETANEIINYLKAGEYKFTNGFIKYKQKPGISRLPLWIFHLFRTPFIEAAIITKWKCKKLFSKINNRVKNNKSL